MSDPAGDLADAVARVVGGVPGVHGLHGGRLGEVATYLPGRRVVGVRVRESTPGRPMAVEVHLAITWPAPPVQTAEEVRAAVSAVSGGPVDVVVEDVVVEDVVVDEVGDSSDVLSVPSEPSR